MNAQETTSHCPKDTDKVNPLPDVVNANLERVEDSLVRARAKLYLLQEFTDQRALKSNGDASEASFGLGYFLEDLAETLDQNINIVGDMKTPCHE